MTDRAPCPICNFTQLCNCDTEADPFYLPGEDAFAGFVSAVNGDGEPDYGRLPDGISCDACECVHKAPACVPDVRDGMPDLTWRSGYELTTAPEERTALADIIRGPETYLELQRMYGGTNGAPIAMPAEKQLGVDMRHPEPSAETLEYWPTEKVSKDELRRQYPHKLFMNPHDYRELAQSFARDRAFEDECKALKRKLHEAAYQRELLTKTPEKIQQDAMAAAADHLKLLAMSPDPRLGKVDGEVDRRWDQNKIPGMNITYRDFYDAMPDAPRVDDTFIHSEEFSRVGSTDVSFGPISCHSSQMPVLEMPYRTFLITGIASERPVARAPAFLRTLGQSESEIAMLQAQLNARPGACSCQRINGFLFACLACSKAGKS